MSLLKLMKISVWTPHTPQGELAQEFKTCSSDPQSAP